MLGSYGLLFWYGSTLILAGQVTFVNMYTYSTNFPNYFMFNVLKFSQDDSHNVFDAFNLRTRFCAVRLG